MQKILVTRPLFPDVIVRLSQYSDVDWNEGKVLPTDALKHHLADKDGALTVGDPVDADALREKRIAAAGLDVFEGEPNVHPVLLTSANAVLTPYIANIAEAPRRAMANRC